MLSIISSVVSVESIVQIFDTSNTSTSCIKQNVRHFVSRGILSIIFIPTYSALLNDSDMIQKERFTCVAIAYCIAGILYDRTIAFKVNDFVKAKIYGVPKRSPKRNGNRTRIIENETLIEAENFLTGPKERRRSQRYKK